jgi:hypothetical protein
MDELDLAYSDDVISYELKVSDSLLSRPLPAWVSIAINEAGDSASHPIYRHLVNSKTAPECPNFMANKIVQKCSEFASRGPLVGGITVMFF